MIPLPAADDRSATRSRRSPRRSRCRCCSPPSSSCCCARWRLGRFADRVVAATRARAPRRRPARAGAPRRRRSRPRCRAARAPRRPRSPRRARQIAAAPPPHGRAAIEHALADYELAAQRRLDRTRLLVRAGPALGLMGTLIPLAPGLAGARPRRRRRARGRPAHRVRGRPSSACSSAPSRSRSRSSAPACTARTSSAWSARPRLTPSRTPTPQRPPAPGASPMNRTGLGRHGRIDDAPATRSTGS